MIRMFTGTVLALAVVCASSPMAAQAAATPKSARVSASAPINLNTATAAQLDALPGVGPSTAQRIVEYRQKNGGFKRVEELMNIRGVGEKSFLKIKPLVMVQASRAEK